MSERCGSRILADNSNGSKWGFGGLVEVYTFLSSVLTDAFAVSKLIFN